MNQANGCDLPEIHSNTHNNNTNRLLLYSANLPVKKTQCASTYHLCKYTHRHKHRLSLPTHTHIMVCLDLWNCLLKKESFELGFEVREDGEIPQAGWQRIPDSWSNATERMVANRFEIAFRGFSRVFCLMIGWCMKSDMCREKLKGKREVSCQNDGRQELRSCIDSRISQAANGVHSVVVLYGLAFLLFVCIHCIVH